MDSASSSSNASSSPPPAIPPRSHRRASSISERPFNYAHQPQHQIVVTSGITSGTGAGARGAHAGGGAPPPPVLDPSTTRLPKSYTNYDLASINAPVPAATDRSSLTSADPVAAAASPTPLRGPSKRYDDYLPSTPIPSLSYSRSEVPPSEPISAATPPRSRQASSTTSISSTPRALHEPPILMPRTLLEPSQASHPSSSSSSMYERVSDQGSDSAESYGWGGLDEPVSAEPTRSPLFDQTLTQAQPLVAPRYGEDAAPVAPAPTTSSGSPSLRRMSRGASVSRTSGAAESDPAAWWKTGSNTASPTRRATSESMCEAAAANEEKEQASVPKGLDSFGIAYIPAENRTPSPRRSTYEPQRPSSIRSRATSPDLSRGSSPLRQESPQPETAAVVSTPMRVQESSPLVERGVPSLGESFRALSPASNSAETSGLRTKDETEGALLKPTSSSGSDERIVPPKSPNRQTSPSLRRVFTHPSPEPALRPSSLAPETTSESITPLATSASLGGTPVASSLSPERKPKRHLPPPPQKSRHRASVSSVLKAKKSTEDAPTSNGTSEQTTASTEEHPPMPMLDVVAARYPVGRDQFDVSPLSASDFAMAYGDRDFGRMPSMYQESDGASSRSSHVRALAVADDALTRDGTLLPSPIEPDSGASVQDTPLASRALVFAVPTKPRSREREPSGTSIVDLESQLTEAIANAATLERDLSLADAATIHTIPQINVPAHVLQEDPRSSTPDAGSVHSARGSSPGVSSEDVFHDASMERGMSNETRRSSGASEVFGVPAQAPIAGTAGPKLDAKARAAAFVADLKRARAAAAAAGQPVALTSPPTSASVEVFDPASITQHSSAAVTASSTVGDDVEEGSPEEVLNRGSPFLPPFATAEASPQLPTPSTYAFDAPRASPYTPTPPTPSAAVAERSTPSPIPASPVRSLIPPGRRGSVSSRSPLIPASSALPCAAFGSPSVALPPPTPRLELRRRRPLPSSLQIINDLKRTRTPGERAKVYAAKMNALRKQDSGIVNWITIVREGQNPGPRGGASSGPSQRVTRHSRDEALTGSFPARPDATRARESTPGTFSQQDLVATVQYPGVLGSIHHSPSSSLSTSTVLPSSRSSIHTSSLPSFPSSSTLASIRPASAIKDKASFFTSLGRKSSKRETSTTTTIPTSPSATTLTGPNGQRLSVSAPFNPSTTNSGAALTNAVPIQSTSRMSIPNSRILGQGGNGAVGKGGGGPPSVTVPSPIGGTTRRSFEGPIGTTHHSSFIYGGLTSTYPETEAGPISSRQSDAVHAAATQDEDDEDTLDKIQRLTDILPYASPAQIRSALKRANGDDVLAISVFLSDDQE